MLSDLHLKGTRGETENDFPDVLLVRHGGSGIIEEYHRASKQMEPAHEILESESICVYCAKFSTCHKVDNRKSCNDFAGRRLLAEPADHEQHSNGAERIEITVSCKPEDCCRHGRDCEKCSLEYVKKARGKQKG
jgi:hypothetical protein